jgi:Zn finger protein HypA/HybF involved in hydrogenase expression
MSDIKFSCLSCGQKIKCDSSHAGLRIPCPGCGVELEIPKGEPAGEQEEIPAQSKAAPAPISPQQTVDQALKTDRKPEVSALATGQARSKSDAGTEPAENLRCLCPVCRSELKIKKPGKMGVPTGTLPVAELVRPGSSGRFVAPVPASEPTRPKPEAVAKTDESATQPKPGKTVEKGSHPPLGTKPRLSYVLTGKPPAPLPRPDGAPRRKKKAKAASQPSVKPGEAHDANPADGA